MPYLGEVMNRKYHVVMYHTKCWLWEKWHSDMRYLYGWHGYHNGRPWYHLCCNGNAGGWRTRVCDWLEGFESGYRYHQDVIYHLDGGDDE